MWLIFLKKINEYYSNSQALTVDEFPTVTFESYTSHSVLDNPSPTVSVDEAATPLVVTVVVQTQSFFEQLANAKTPIDIVNKIVAFFIVLIY